MWTLVVLSSFYRMYSGRDADPVVVLFGCNGHTGTTCEGDGGSEMEHKNHRHTIIPVHTFLGKQFKIKQRSTYMNDTA